FHDDWITDFSRDLDSLFRSSDNTLRSRKDRYASFLHQRTSPLFQAHIANDFRLRSNECQAGLLANFCEVCVLAQQAVARMNRVGVRDLGCADDRNNVEIASGTARRPDTNRFICQPHVQTVAISLGIDGYGSNPKIAACADYPESDFTAIRDQNLVE